MRNHTHVKSHLKAQAQAGDPAVHQECRQSFDPHEAALPCTANHTAMSYQLNARDPRACLAMPCSLVIPTFHLVCKFASPFTETALQSRARRDCQAQQSLAGTSNSGRMCVRMRTLDLFWGQRHDQILAVDGHFALQPRQPVWVELQHCQRARSAGRPSTRQAEFDQRKVTPAWTPATATRTNCGLATLHLTHADGEPAETVALRRV